MSQIELTNERVYATVAEMLTSYAQIRAWFDAVVAPPEKVDEFKSKAAPPQAPPPPCSHVNGKDADLPSGDTTIRCPHCGYHLAVLSAEWPAALAAPPDEPPPLRVEVIQRVVARHYDTTRLELISQRRTAKVVRPRQVAMYIAKMMTVLSLPQIGRQFGNRDHTTILHAVRKIRWLIESDQDLADKIAEIRVELAQGRHQ